MTTDECSVALSGRHQFNPKQVSKFGNGAAPWDTVYRCVCGQYAPNNAEVEAALAETREERARQADLSRKQVEQAMKDSALAFGEQKEMPL